MAHTYRSTRCEVCGKYVSNNGLATTAHKQKHVGQGLMSDNPVQIYKYGDGKYHTVPRHFDITTEGQAVAQAAAAAIRQLYHAMQAARAAYDAVPETAPAWTDVYTAMTTAEQEYRDYVHPAGK